MNLESLSKRLPDLRKLLSGQRINAYKLANSPLQFSYSCAQVDDEILAALQQLADERNVIQKAKQVFAGEPVNVGEKRAVLHHKTRSRIDRGHYGEEQRRIAAFCTDVHSSARFKRVVHIGIGGSDLGPRALYTALKRYKTPLLPVSFVSNVDPDDINVALHGVDIASTLFILVSKSGSTQETRTNFAFVEEAAARQNVSPSVIAVTAKGSPMDDPKKYVKCFYIDDAIGGRFSSTSAVGGCVLSLAFGPDVFDELLLGASDLDEACLNPSITNNMSLLSALIGVWERQYLGYTSRAIIPYSEALSRFPAHLQQLECESNGKAVSLQNQQVNTPTSPVLFGEPGTNAQHSFFQMLHQGTDVIPVQFIGFKESQIKNDVVVDGSTSREKLKANLVAQMVALARGHDDEHPNKRFPGNRPSTLVFADELTPRVLGALLAFYENQVMFEGFLWDINSYDQEGVQLGKTLTNEILTRKDEMDPVLKAFWSFVN